MDRFGLALDCGSDGDGGCGGGCADCVRVTRFALSESSRARLLWCCAASVLGLGPELAPNPSFRTKSSVVMTCGAAFVVAALATCAAVIGATMPELHGDAAAEVEDAEDAWDDSALVESGLAPAGPDSDNGVVGLDELCCCCIPCGGGCIGNSFREF